MSYIKELQKQIAELNLRIQQNQGDVAELQNQLNKLLIAEFEEELAHQLALDEELAYQLILDEASLKAELEDNTLILYYHSEIYNILKDSGINYKDPYFKFKWPFEPKVISEKDLNSSFLNLNKK